jgi:hypothetical protein
MSDVLAGHLQLVRIYRVLRRSFQAQNLCGKITGAAVTSKQSPVTMAGRTPSEDAKAAAAAHKFAVNPALQGCRFGGPKQ